MIEHQQFYYQSIDYRSVEIGASFISKYYNAVLINKYITILNYYKCE